MAEIVLKDGPKIDLSWTVEFLRKMPYLIPSGTPVELYERGKDAVVLHTTDHDLLFPSLSTESTEEYFFDLDGRLQMAVSKSLVVRNAQKVVR